MNEKVVVHDVCTCGKPYRVRHPHAGYTFACTACGREITITEADILVAPPDLDDTVPLLKEDDGADGTNLLEAKPLDDVVIRPAGHGRKPGELRGVEYVSDEAALMHAMSGRPLTNTYDDLNGPPVHAIYEEPRVIRSFVPDLFASLYLTGSRHNLLSIGGSILGCSLPLMIYNILPRALQIVAWLVIIPFSVLVGWWLTMFFWQTLCRTAAGEDEVPWVESNWDFWSDTFWPSVYFFGVTFFCCLPSLLAWWLCGYLEQKVPGLQLHGGWIALGLLVVGLFFWPVGMMSVALGDTLLFLRPDWLVRCVIGIGPIYILPWLLCMGIVLVSLPVTAIASLVSLVPYVGGLVSPLLLMTIEIYLGYVLFRTLGLLFRHFRERFPWKF